MTIYWSRKTDGSYRYGMLAITSLYSSSISLEAVYKDYFFLSYRIESLFFSYQWNWTLCFITIFRPIDSYCNAVKRR